jgi:hypothetical protein
MTNELIQEHDAETGEIIVREFTDAEQALRNEEITLAEAKNAAEEIERSKAIEADAILKKALLERLGITADEAKLLLA